VTDDIRRGAFGRVPDELGDPLTEQEVEQLPQGTEIVIVWSGGNGPHRGRIVFSDVTPFYVPEHEYERGPDGPMWFYNPITFVGDQRFHTRVWAVVQESQA
jgi:hypothetical protein